MRMFLWTIAILMFGTSNSFAQISPSFDCAKAKTEVEELICSDEELAKLDVEMSEAYKKFMATLDDEYNQNKLKNKQKTWLNNRSKVICMNDDNIDNKKSCLKHVYETRIKDLTSWAKRENYDFFMDYGDFVEAKDLVGFRKRIGKFVAKDGREYYINCQYRSIFPTFPEGQKLLFEDWVGSKSASNTEIIYQNDDVIFFLCKAISEYAGDTVPSEFEERYLHFDKYTKLKVFPEAHDEKAFDLEQVKEKLKEIDNPDVYGYWDKDKCTLFWDELKASNIEFIRPKFVVQSYEELRDKVGLTNCTKEKFDNIYVDKKYPLDKYPNHYNKPIPNFIWYDLDGKKILIYNNFTFGSIRNRICVFNEENCGCEYNTNFVGDTQLSPLAKINGEYYFAKTHEGDRPTDDVGNMSHYKSVYFYPINQENLKKESFLDINCGFETHNNSTQIKGEQ